MIQVATYSIGVFYMLFLKAVIKVELAFALPGFIWLFIYSKLRRKVFKNKLESGILRIKMGLATNMPKRIKHQLLIRYQKEQSRVMLESLYLINQRLINRRCVMFA